MNTLNKNTLKDFLLKAFNIDILNIEENSIVDVSDKNVKILSYNHKYNKQELKRVNKIIRKKNSSEFLINSSLRCSKEHRLFVKTELGQKLGVYLEVKDLLKLKDFYVLTEENTFIKGTIQKTKTIIPIFDLEVQDNHNFYTNGILSHNSYNPLVEPGGEAWKYFQHLKIEISKSLDRDKVTKDVYGIIVGGKITKSKVCQPFKTFEYYVEFGRGIVPSYEILELSIEHEIIIKTGNTYSWKDCKLGVGLKQLTDFIEDNPEVLMEIEEELKEKLNIK